MKIKLLFAVSIGIAGCAPSVSVGRFTADTVEIVESRGFQDDTPAMNEAKRVCAIYSKAPVEVKRTCYDGSSIISILPNCPRRFTFACVDEPKQGGTQPTK